MKEYVLRVIAAAIVCAIVRGLLDKKSAPGRVAALVSGILMAVTVISPIGYITFSGISDILEELTVSADHYVQEGISAADELEIDIIKSQSEAYILDKANRMGLEITVEVELDDQNGNIPCGVVITGNISPYGQTQLGSYIEDTLGIAKENQIWK